MFLFYICTRKTSNFIDLVGQGGGGGGEEEEEGG